MLVNLDARFHLGSYKSPTAQLKKPCLVPQTPENRDKKNPLISVVTEKESTTQALADDAGRTTQMNGRKTDMKTF